MRSPNTYSETSLCTCSRSSGRESFSIWERLSSSMSLRCNLILASISSGRCSGFFAPAGNGGGPLGADVSEPWLAPFASVRLSENRIYPFRPVLRHASRIVRSLLPVPRSGRTNDPVQFATNPIGLVCSAQGPPAVDRFPHQIVVFRHEPTEVAMEEFDSIAPRETAACEQLAPVFVDNHLDRRRLIKSALQGAH